MASFTAAFLPHREIARLWLRFLFADPNRVDDRIIDSYARAAGSRGYAAATVSAIRAMGKLELPTSAVGPALLVWGEEDPIFRPKGAAAWQSKLPSAELLLLPACGHCPLEEAPAAVGVALEAFLAKLNPSGASAGLPN
jgi:pimeloyl-ACP methyl ester carboxylesterase